MTLTDPREALADQSSFIDYLVGLAGVARTVRALAADGDRRSGADRGAGDFEYVLLGLASLGRGVERLADLTGAQGDSAPPAPTIGRWLR